MDQEKENPLRDKSYAFALTMVKRCFLLQRESNDSVISKKLMRSATAIGSNIEEAIGGHSSKNFRKKIFISYKKAREIHYWVRLLGDAEIFTDRETNEYLEQVEELLRIMASIQKNMEANKDS